MERYEYPDKMDRITAEFIASHEPYEGYWSESEVRALENLERHLASRGILPDRSRTVLDAGCGEGRLLSWFGRFGREIVALDPDEQRLAKAETIFTEASFVQGYPGELAHEPFDITVCSHVIQHVSSEDLTPLLAELRTLTKPDGLLVLMFSRAPVGCEGFYIATLGKEHSVDVHQFNNVLRSGAEKQLPFRLFDPEKLKETARGLGWMPEWEWTFHVLDNTDDLGEDLKTRDDKVNADLLLSRRLGRDMMMVWRRDDS